MSTQDDITKWIDRANELLNSGTAATHQLPPFAVSMLSYFYGPNSSQMSHYQQAVNNCFKDKTSGAPAHQVFLLAKGTVRNIVMELQNGLVSSLRTVVQGEVLGDLL